jgi:ferrochelatase
MDGFLLLSFGGPEGPADVLPFLRNVTRGRGVPDERLAEVAAHYEYFGGVSPINDQNRALLAAVAAEFHTHDIGLPLYWGNRNWAPFVDDTVEQMRLDGVTRAFVFATSATGGYSSCRQYRENLAAAQVDGAPELVKLRHYFDHPGFVAANVDGLRATMRTVAADARLVFTAHSIPLSMNETAGPSGGLYLAQQRETARLVAEAVRGPGAEFDLVWQSRSGPPRVPWLDPDINDHLRALDADGVRSVVVCPTGFVSDHLEVMWDLDHEARATAAGLGLEFARSPTPSSHPAFVRMIRELVEEQLVGAEPLRLGDLGLCGVDCPPWCCLAPQRPLHPAQPVPSSAL